MRTAMKTHFFLMSTVAVLGTSLLATSYAASNSEYVHLTRHRDSNGNLLMAPTQHQAEPSVMKKMMMPSQPKALERRSTDWGMSVQEVKDNELVKSSWDLQSPVLADYEQRVAYHTQIEGIEAALTYSFYENHLGQAKYVFEPQHDDAVEFVQDFNTVKKWIKQSYGEPTSVQEIWLDELYQYDSSLWGQAVMRGHLVMVAEWKNPGTDIVLVLDGGDDTVGLVADFSSTTFVVPVSFGTQSPEENVEGAIDDNTVQTALPAEPTENSVDQDLSVQGLSPEHEVQVEHKTEAEVASKGSVNEIQDLEEIEQLLKEEYPPTTLEDPVTEDGSVDAGMKNVVSDEATNELIPDTHASMHHEAVEHDILDEPLIDEQHLVGEGTLGKGVEQDSLIEPSVTIQDPEHPMDMDMSELMPIESSANESTAAVHQVEEPVLETQVQEAQMNVSETMPVDATTEEPTVAVHQVEEPVLETQVQEAQMDVSEAMSVDATTEEPTVAVHQVEEPMVETQVQESQMDISEAMPVEAAMEEPTTAVHQVEEPVVETQVEEHTMDVSEAMPVEAAMEESITAVHQSEEPVVEHAIDEHANVHSIEAEVDSQHHL